MNRIMAFLTTHVAALAPQITLTPDEQKIFSFLREATDALNMPTTLRVAGGWVRDKLLGKPSDDIDIGLDNCTGLQFSERLSAYSKAYARRTGHPHPALGKSYVVDANPDKSKHLETVGVEIYGQKIDFVNLRSETYGESRIPTMEMGTPEADASRRDLTINAIFYNINTGQIEDYVGGLQDLQTMTLRTPLDPKKTFMDDPLRILRAVRFFGRYPSAKLDPAMVEAMKLPEVHEAYRSKVSSERSGPELLKTLGGARPAEALQVLFDTGMDAAVFNVPETQGLNDWRMDQRTKHHKFNVLEHTLLVVKNLDDLMKKENVDPSRRVPMLLAALLHDIGKLHPEIAKPHPTEPGRMMYKGHEDRSVTIAESIMKSIGIPEGDRKLVNRIIGLHMRPHSKDWSPKSIGKFLRDTEIPGQDSGDIAQLVMLHAMADQLATGVEKSEDPTEKQDLLRRINEMKTRPGPSVFKPLLNGNDLIPMFPNIKPNTGFIREISERLMQMQAEGTVMDKEQAKAAVEQMRVEIEAKYGPNRTAAWVVSNCKLA